MDKLNNMQVFCYLAKMDEKIKQLKSGIKLAVNYL